MMKRDLGAPLFLMLFPAMLLWGGSSLELYRDGAVYRYIPVDDYIGFLESGEARCGERSIAMEHRGSCPETKRLCKERMALEKADLALRKTEETLRILEEVEKQVKPTEMPADKWIASAEKLGARHAELSLTAERLKEKRTAMRERFDRQVSSDEALFLGRDCKGELELTIPAGLIDVSIGNEAELDGGKALTISHDLLLRNHSGVEISVKDARIYARNRRLRLHPILFTPWIVRPAPPPSKHPIRRVAYRGGRGPTPESTGIVSAPSPAPVVEGVRKIEARNYAIGKLDLPSTGEEVRVKLSEYRVEARCEELAYPYLDPHLYRACRFRPREEIVGDVWRIREGRRLVSDRAIGRYEKGEYLLFVDRDDSVRIRHRPLVEKERSSGIFGGKIRRKDGFVDRLVNASDSPKRITLIERIPRSTTGRIDVKLLKVEGGEKRSLNDEGRLEILVNLGPSESREVKVLFELRYDKDLKVLY